MAIEIKYTPQENEEKEQNNWFSSDVYYWDEKNTKSPKFVIDTPPPTVSGVLHMGHVFSYCQTDFIARYHRLKGDNVYYPIGFDDNGLPTERLTEKVNKVKGCWMAKNGRTEEFVEMCQNVVADAEVEFERLFKSLGISYDWRQKYQTISKSTEELVLDTFEKLHNSGLAYQKNGPVYWDVVDQTALAQSIIEDKEVESCEYYLKCVVKETGEELKIMTTRPEFLPSCVAVFYNPEDTRYQHLQGKTAILPFADEIKFLPDEAVKMDKGIGLVMCCTYGDWQDVEWVRKYNLQHKIIVQKDGTFLHEMYRNTDETVDENGIKACDKKPFPFKAIQAREIIVKKLLEGNYIIDKKPIRHMVKVGERSKEPIEIIESTQWYVKTLDFKEDLIVLSQYLNFHPEHFKNRLIQWIEGLNQDWCISRDRFFGINIPQNAYKSGEEVQQVFDTWFTSSSSPFVSTKNREELRPSNLRPQAHEIIRTWTFSTLHKTYLMSLIRLNLLEERNQQKDIKKWLESKGAEFIKREFLPWSDVALSGWCLAKDGTKMSKSKGNVVTPVDLIREKGSDVVRYWSSSCSLGVDTAFNETKFLDGKKLITKLINASKFVVSHFPENDKLDSNVDIKNIDKTVDKWLLTRLNDVLKQYIKNFEEFEYSKAKDVVERFFWNDFCDNYLEICKSRVYAGDKSAKCTLILALDTIIRLFSPFIPHITGYLYRTIFGGDVHRCGSLSKLFDFNFTDKQAVEDMKTGLEIINFVRQKKADLKISIKAPIKKLVVPAMPKTIEEDIKAMLSVESVEVGEKMEMIL